MTIRDRTRPPLKPRKSGMSTIQTVGTNPPPSLDTPLPSLPGRPGPRQPGLPPTNGGVVPPGMGSPVPYQPPAPVQPPLPTPNTPIPQPTPYPEPVPPATPPPVPTVPPVSPPVAPNPLFPEPAPAPGTPTIPRPLYPEPPNMGIPGGPGSGQTPPPTGPGGSEYPYLGLDFMREVTPNELVANQLDSLLGSNSPYIQNARQRGIEYAASRGNINGSMAAGSSQRAALEAALPIAQSDADVYRQANAGNFDSLSQLRQMRVAGDIENWLQSESYSRDFNGRLAMMPIQSSIDMLEYITQRSMEDPAVWTPDVMSGFSNFFNGNMFDVLSRFYGPQTAPGGG